MSDRAFSLDSLSTSIRPIAEKVLSGERISVSDGLCLYNSKDLGSLGTLANLIRERANGDYVYFNRNLHIEPTNLCVFDCKFCSYSRLLKQKGDEDAWEYNADDMLQMVKNHDQDITEVHVVGGVHPKMDLYYFADLLKKIKVLRPDLHIKAFTAVEIDYMARKAKLNYKDALQHLKDSGLGSIPGGGAEIFDHKVRNQICEDKCSSEEWLEIHKTAHELGIHSNATMLYGHIESYENRIDHLDKLRQLQDQTKGFNCFIPLKFRNANNQMSDHPEVSVIEDLKNYAVSRIFLDNFKHLKAYWPMIGKNTAQLSLQFGVDDLDGTINDSTRIYSMAGAEDQNPSMSTNDLVKMIISVGRVPVERDTVYNILREHKGQNEVLEA